MMFDADFNFRHIETWSARFRVLFALAYFVSLLLIGYFILISVQISQANKVREKLADAEKQYLSITQKKVVLKAYEKQVGALIRKYDVIMALMPDEKRASSFMADVYNIARKRGVIVNKIKPNVIKVGEISYELPINVDVEGDYFSVARFLSDLANYAHIVSFSDMTLSKQSGSSISQVKLSFLLHTYYVDRQKVKSINDIKVEVDDIEKQSNRKKKVNGALKNLKFR